MKKASFQLQAAIPSSSFQRVFSGDSIPNELWLQIFSFLDTESLFKASLTSRRWREILGDQFWEDHFSQNYSPTTDFNFPSWKISALIHYYFRTGKRLDEIARYPGESLEFWDWVDPQRALVTKRGIVKILRLKELTAETPFPHPVDSLKVVAGRVVAFFSRNMGFGFGLKGNRSFLPFVSESFYPIYRSSKTALPDRPFYEKADVGRIMLKRWLIFRETGDHCFPTLKGFQPTLYDSKDDALVIGFYPGRIQLYQSQKLVWDYLEETDLVIVHLSLQDNRVIVGYGGSGINSNSLEELMIYDRDKEEIVLRIAPLSCFLFYEDRMIYSNVYGDLFSLDLHSFCSKTHFTAQKGRHDFPNTKINKVVFQEGHLFTLRSNGDLYHHHLATNQSRLIRETKIIGYASSQTTLMSTGPYLVLQEDQWIEVYKIEIPNQVTPVLAKRMDHIAQLFRFGAGVVCDFETAIELTIDLTIDQTAWIRYENVLSSTICHDCFVVAFKHGDIIFLNHLFENLFQLKFSTPIVHVKGIEHYLLCVGEEGSVWIIDMVTRETLLERKKLLDKDTDFSREPFLAFNVADSPFFVRSEGVFMENKLLISINRTLLTLDIATRKDEFTKEVFSDVVTFQSSIGGVYCLNSQKESVGWIPIHTLALEKITPSPCIGKFEVYFDRFILFIRSNGLLEIRDIEKPRNPPYVLTSVFESAHDFEFGDKQKIKEVGQDQLLIFSKKFSAFLFQLLTGDIHLIDNHAFHSWHEISHEQLLMVFENGKVAEMNCLTGALQIIQEECEGYWVTEARYFENQITIFYEKEPFNLGEDSWRKVQLIHLEKRELNEFFNDYVERCQVKMVGEKAYLIKTYSDAYDCHYDEIIDCETKQVVEFKDSPFSHHWIYQGDGIILYLKYCGAICVYDFESQEEKTLTTDLENHTVLMAETFEEKVYCCFNSEYLDPEYDGGGGEDRRIVYVFDPQDTSFKTPVEGIYRNEGKILIVDEKGSFILFDYKKKTFDYDSKAQPKPVFCYDTSFDRILFGKNDRRKSSLKIWDLKNKGSLKEIDTVDGTLIYLSCFDTKIYAWVVNWRSQSDQMIELLVIDKDLSMKRISYTGILEGKFIAENFKSIENKVLIHSGEKLYQINLESGGAWALISKTCKSYHLANRNIVVQSHEGISIHRITSQS